MTEFINEQWDMILLVLGNLLVILRMLSTLKGQVKKTSADSIALFNQVKSEISKADKDVITLSKGMDIILDFIESESLMRSVSQVVPEEYKDKYKQIKEHSEEIHKAIKELSA